MGMSVRLSEYFSYHKISVNRALHSLYRWLQPLSGPQLIAMPLTAHVHCPVLTGLQLTSWSRALLEKPPVVQLLENFPAFYGTRRFITAFTRVLHWSLSWARSIQSISPYPISLRSILILSTHRRLGLPSGPFPSGFPTISYMHSSSPQFVLHALPISSSLTWSF
jgi:hypothetical protein